MLICTIVELIFNTCKRQNYFKINNGSIFERYLAYQ